jgi:hypothetical protein
MSTRANPMAGRYFNDPGIAAAVSNLAGAFAPPSPEEYLLAEQVKGERTTNATRDKMLRLAGDDFDSLAYIMDIYDPVNGLESMRGGLANERRGQDITAETSRANNAADNDRAMRTSLLTGAMNPDGRQAMDEELLNTIMPGLGLPSVPSAMPVAPTDAQERGRLIAQNAPSLTADDVYALTMDGVDTQQIVTDSGNRLTFGALAARDGAEPYNPTGGQAAADLVSYVTPDGQEGSAIFDPNTQLLVDANTKQPLPEGTQTYRLQGGDKAAMTGATTSNITEGNRIIAESAYGKQRASKFLALIEANPGVLGIPGTIRGFAQDIVAGAGELGAAYGESVGSLEEVQAMAAQVAQSNNYTPEIAQAFNYALEMAYLAANMQDPGGEVGIRELATNLSQYDGGIAGNEKVKATLAVLIGQMDDRAAYGRSLRDGPGSAPAAPAGAGTPPPADPATAATGPVTITSDADYDALPSGTEFVGPDGKTRRKP